jgi:hypothetical protein
MKIENNEFNNRLTLFSRIMLIMILFLILIMIIYKYFFKEPEAEISIGLLFLLSYLIIIALSEVYDNFSVGKILKLSRNLKEKDNKIHEIKSELIKIETEKNQLFNQVIHLSNNINQRQTNTNIYGVPHEFMKQMGVQKANEDEVKEFKKNEVEEIEKEENIKSKIRRLNINKVENLALKKFMIANNIDYTKIFREIKLQAFQGVDPISDTSPIFDAYLNEIDKEVFFEIRPIRGYISSIFIERLYLMLSKIYHYRNINKTQSYLHLILVELPNERFEDKRILSKLLELFNPAINNNLLKIGSVRFETKEMDDLYDA